MSASVAKISRTQIDKSGRALSKSGTFDDFVALELEEVFDKYRSEHLRPLSEITMALQGWLSERGGHYYIAQRLKRKPQIIRKLQRLSVRLTQLQDIGGCRIVVDSNKDVDDLLAFIKAKIVNGSDINIVRITDYRQKGRDDTGYRSLHVILEKSERVVELQIRSNIQHYWAESIERTSVVYKRHLKEGDGDHVVIKYFQILSDIFFDIEAGQSLSTKDRIEIERLRQESESIIEKADGARILFSFVNEDVIKAIAGKEARNPAGLNNWIIIFDWNTGSFIHWDIVGRSPEEAIKEYVRWENEFRAADGYEVVLVGSSDIATIRQTHSHYFGIDSLGGTLENLNQAIIGFSKKMDLDIGARQILHRLATRRYWGKNSVSISTLKNHFCADVITFEKSLETLREKNLVIVGGGGSPISLNLKTKTQIDKYL